MSFRYGYPFSSIRGDYIRSIIGLGICTSPFLFGMPPQGALILVAIVAVLFGLFLLRTIARHVTTITVDETNIRVKTLNEFAVPWGRISELSVSYFTTWRNGGKGWMQLRLKGGGKTLRVESSINGFEEITHRAVKAACENHLDMSSATLSNLEALGISVPDQGMAS